MIIKSINKANIFLSTSILSHFLLIISCTSKETIVVENNSPPVIENQSFTVLENIGKFETIGVLEAYDGDDDSLTFEIESEIDLIINESNGEIRTTSNLILDYETNSELTFNVSVIDKKGGRAEAVITIIVINVDDGPLTNLQKDFLDEFIFVTYNLSPSSFGGTLSEKWIGTIKLYLEGNITDDFRQMVINSLNDFNTLFTDGTKIELVTTFEDSSVHLILGPKSSIANVWPNMYEAVKYSSFKGYALYDRNFNYEIYKGRIWMNYASRGLFIHELGHILGFGHASNAYCGSFENPSFMCSMLSNDFNALDKEIIKALYNLDITALLTQNEMRALITNYIIDNAILK